MNDQAQHEDETFDGFRGLPEGSLRVLQITDPHLYEDTSQRLVGVKTHDSFESVVALARRALPVDLVLLTGDLVHDSSPAGYERFRLTIETLGAPGFCLPGNHDVTEVMTRCLNNGQLKALNCDRVGPWGFVMLDSTIPYEAGSRFTEAELARMERCLEGLRDCHVLVCLHHQPLPMESTWLDTMMVENREAFWAIIDRFPNVRGILFGHVHQQFDSMRNGIPVMATPSTSIQFAPKRVDFGLDAIPPGYRWLALLPDGTIRTGVERLTDAPEGLELDIWGYM